MLKVEVFEEEFLSLINEEQELQLLGCTGGFGEGPIWSSAEQDLTFSDMTTQRTFRWSEEEGLRLIREHTNVGNGQAYDCAGRIIVCEQIGYRMARIDRDMTNYQIIAAEYGGKQFNGPNDVVVHSNGLIYFTDPHFGRRPTRHGRFGSAPQPCQGIYMINPESLEVTLATAELDNPNGLCFSLDETRMYFAETTTYQLTVMDLKPDGTLWNKRLFARTPHKGPGAPDGIKVDVLENIWITAQGGVHVYDRGGRILGIVLMPGPVTNLCFGGPGMKHLFICSGDGLYRIETQVAGPVLRR